MKLLGMKEVLAKDAAKLHFSVLKDKRHQTQKENKTLLAQEVIHRLTLKRII